MADVAARLRPWEALLAWVSQHNELALGLSALAELALRSAPADHLDYVDALAVRLREDARFAAEWARRAGGEPANATPATVALLHLIAQIGEAHSYSVQAVALWQWFEIQYLAWAAEVMLRRPASDLRRRFASQFSWDVVRPFRQALNRRLAANPDECLGLQHVFDQLTGQLADWQAERAALAGPALPPEPLQPGQGALRIAKPGIAAMERLLSTTWDFKRPLHEHVPELPEGITCVPESRYLMALLEWAFCEPTRAEEEGEPPLDELLAAIAGGVEALAGPPEHHARWGDVSLTDAPFADGAEAWVWVVPSARVALTSFEYDHHLPALVQAFVVPPAVSRNGPTAPRRST